MESARHYTQVRSRIWLARVERVTVFPWYERLEDPKRPGRMTREWTIDGDHPSVEGYRRLSDTIRLEP